MASPALEKKTFYQEKEEEGHALPVPKGNIQKGFLVSQASLRILAMVSSFTALAILENSKESIFVFGIRFEAYYSYASSFRFLMVVDAVVGSFSAVSLGAVCLIGRSPSSSRCFCLFVLDVLVMLLTMSGCSAATGVGYVAKYGEEKMGWLPLCYRVTKFCNRVTLSIAFSYVVLLCFIALTISSSFKLVSRLHR